MKNISYFYHRKGPDIFFYPVLVRGRKTNIFLLGLHKFKYFSCQTELNYYLSALTYYPFFYGINSLLMWWSCFLPDATEEKKNASESLKVIEYCNILIFEKTCTYLWEQVICCSTVWFTILEFDNFLYFRHKHFIFDALFNQLLRVSLNRKAN